MRFVGSTKTVSSDVPAGKAPLACLPDHGPESLPRRGIRPATRTAVLRRLRPQGAVRSVGTFDRLHKCNTVFPFAKTGPCSPFAERKPEFVRPEPRGEGGGVLSPPWRARRNGAPRGWSFFLRGPKGCAMRCMRAAPSRWRLHGRIASAVGALPAGSVSWTGRRPRFFGAVPHGFSCADGRAAHREILLFR